MDRKSWFITAAGIDTAVELSDGSLIWSMINKAHGMNIVSGNLGDLIVDGYRPQWTEVVSVKKKTEQSSKSIEIIVKDKTGSLKLTRYIIAYKNHPFVRIWGILNNVENKSVIITECKIADFVPKSDLPLTMFHVEQFSAKYRENYFTKNETSLIAGSAAHEICMGSYPSKHWQPTSCAWFALLSEKEAGWDDCQPESGNGLVCGIEFNGKSRVKAWSTSTQPHIASAIDNLSYKLSPEKAFEIPAFFVGQFNGDWDEAGYVTQRFAESHIHPPMPDDNYPWAQYNSWAYGQDINEPQQLCAIDRCAKLGIELVVLDLGWARTIGDWRPDPVKFPRGFKPLAERAKSYGMHFGVHVALAQCNAEAPIAKAHPEWLIHDQIDYFGASPICLGHEPCRNWLIKQLNRLIEEEGIDYIVQDGEDMVKACSRTDHTHAAGDSNYSNSQYGLDIVINRLRRSHPNLVIENCEDGGCMMTYKMAGLYHTSITVDNIDTYSTRQGIYGASYVFSPRYNVRYMQDAPTRYTLLSSIFGGPLIFMHRITEWNNEQTAAAKRAIREYKKIREVVREAKVIHLKAPKSNIPGGWGWDAIQAVTADKSQSVMMVYRANGGASEENIAPRGLMSDKLYKVKLMDSDIIYYLTGEDLMKGGIIFKLDENSAEMVLIKG